MVIGCFGRVGGDNDLRVAYPSIGDRTEAHPLMEPEPLTGRLELFEIAVEGLQYPLAPSGSALMNNGFHVRSVTGGFEGVNTVRYYSRPPTPAPDARRGRD